MKVLQHGKTEFTGTCNRCGCIFEYTFDDLRSNYPLKYVKCPDCGNEVYHKDQSELASNNVVTYVDLDHWMYTPSTTGTIPNANITLTTSSDLSEAKNVTSTWNEAIIRSVFTHNGVGTSIVGAVNVKGVDV